MSTCLSCHALIIWGVTARGKRVPVDADPVETGNLAIQYPPGAQVRYLKNGESPGPDEWRSVSHFATCPDAKLHRKSR